MHGLVALMEIQQSRARARVGPGGEPVLLADQDRTRWDRLLIARGLAALARATELGGARAVRAAGGDRRLPRAGAQRGGDRLGADHAALRRARRARPVAGRRAQPRRRDLDGGRAAAPAWRRVDAIAAEPALRAYHLLHAVRGDLLERLGRHAEASAEFTRAASLTRNARERELLLARTRDG